MRITVVRGRRRSGNALRTCDRSCVESTVVRLAYRGVSACFYAQPVYAVLDETPEPDAGDELRLRSAPSESLSCAFGVFAHGLLCDSPWGIICQVMTTDIRRLMHAAPFVPFTIHLADGGQLRVPSVDHVAISPTGGRVIVFADDDTHAVLSPLLISRLTIEGQPANGKPSS